MFKHVSVRFYTFSYPEYTDLILILSRPCYLNKEFLNNTLTNSSNYTQATHIIQMHVIYIDFNLKISNWKWPGIRAYFSVFFLACACNGV